MTLVKSLYSTLKTEKEHLYSHLTGGYPLELETPLSLGNFSQQCSTAVLCCCRLYRCQMGWSKQRNPASVRDNKPGPAQFYHRAHAAMLLASELLHRRKISWPGSRFLLKVFFLKQQNNSVLKKFCYMMWNFNSIFEAFLCFCFNISIPSHAKPDTEQRWVLYRSPASNLVAFHVLPPNNTVPPPPVCQNYICSSYQIFFSWWTEQLLILSWVCVK